MSPMFATVVNTLCESLKKNEMFIATFSGIICKSIQERCVMRFIDEASCEEWEHPKCEKLT